MDFNPTETQTILAKSVSDLLAKNYDRAARRATTGARPRQATELWKQIAGLGLLGIEIEDDFGGSGASFEDLASVLEPFGRALVVEPFIPCVVIGAFLLNTAGTAAQKSAYVPKVADGELKLVLAHAERAARQELSWVETTATPVAEGYRLNGEKTIVFGGDEAGVFAVSARAAAGVSLFLVPAAAAGVSLRRHRLYDGTGAADVSLADVVVPADALLGGAGTASQLIEAAYDRGAAAVCVEAVGAMERLCEMTVEYLKTREQFGQPIGKFQVLQHRAVDMRVALELARSMALVAVDAITHGDSGARARRVSAAKVVVSQSARVIGQSAVQLHGGIALTEEYDAGHYFKRLTAIERLFGDAGYHVARFAAIGER